MTEPFEMMIFSDKFALFELFTLRGCPTSFSTFHGLDQYPDFGFRTRINISRITRLIRTLFVRETSLLVLSEKAAEKGIQ